MLASSAENSTEVNPGVASPCLCHDGLAHKIFFQHSIASKFTEKNRGYIVVLSRQGIKTGLADTNFGFALIK